jgi:hypothetical protein
MQKDREIVASFLKNIIEKEQNKDILLLNYFNTPKIPKVLDFSFSNIIELNNEYEFAYIKQKSFDYIIGALPFGMQPILLDTTHKIKGNKNWSYILDSLRVLKEDGKAFYLIEPSLLFLRQGKEFLNYLSEKGFFYNSLFELPEKILYPETVFQPIIIQFEKMKHKKLFIAEITGEFENLASNLYERTNTNNLTTGILVDYKDFESFEKFKTEREIENLKTQYKEYNSYSLTDISSEINTTRDTFQEKQNCIYIPFYKNSLITSNIDLLNMKHQNYFQIVLKPNLVKAEFLVMFFCSDLGKKQIQILLKRYSIPKINKNDISKCIVSIPPLSEQEILIFTDIKLSEFQDIINNLKNEISLNPKNVNLILDKFNNIQKPLKYISEKDQILKMLRIGENKYIEFKETFSKNLKKNIKDDNIRKASLKTIVGFLNADGGTLLIGIDDKGEIKGVENDYFESKDDYIKNFKNLIKEKIGPDFYTFINWDLIEVEGKNILKVDCKPSNKACFFEDKEFFVRTNPATDKLEGRKQQDYIDVRFK